MPGIEDLDRFKKSFRTIGDEAAVLAQRGERLQDLPLPEESIDEDLASLLEAPPSENEETEFGQPEGIEPVESDPGTEQSADEGFDFGAFIDSIPEDLSPPPDDGESEPNVPEDLLAGFADELEAAASEPEPEEAAPFENPEEAEALSVDDFAIPGFEESEPGELAETAEAQDAAGDDDFAMPDFEDATLSEDEAVPPLEESASEEAAEEEAEGFSLFAEEAPPTAEEVVEEIEEEESADAGFSMPDFDMGEESVAETPSSAEEAADDFAMPGEEPEVDDFGNLVGEDEAAEDAPLDSFDTFSLDDDFLSAGFGVQESKADKKSTDDGFATLEDFSLEGIDDVFKAPQPPAARGAPERRKQAAPATGGEDIEEINLSDDDYSRLQETLASYPLNLRIACEELIAEHAVPPDQMAALVKMLVKGTGAKETAILAGRLIGRPIVIPKGFEKSSGAAREAEKSTFAYMFVHTILPILRIFLFAGLVAASLAYLGIEFVYKPLRANSLYAQGHKRVQAGDYARGNERFDEAGRIWRMKKWHFEYARTFIEKRQYLLAEQKYDQLLAAYPRNKAGALEYAEFESRTLRNYEKAERILRREILDHALEDREGLLALGDNNLAWGEIDPSRYEEARKAYARLMGRYGRQDEYLERMLRYFIRTDNLAETLPLQEHFLASNKRKISASTLAELGGYYLDKKTAVAEGVPDAHITRIENIRELLQDAIRRDSTDPEAHYHLARYNERYGRPAEEKRAVERAIRAFAAAPEISARRTSYRIDAHRRLASLLVREKEFISAEESLIEGIRIYEDARSRRLLGRTAEFGRLYADLGDIEYFKAGDLDAAVRNYKRAETDGWAPPELRYRLGYASYVREDWQTSVESFFKAAAEFPLNRRILFSLGNALYRRGNLHAAQGYYNRLLDLLEAERARFPVLLPNDRPDHADLAERLMRARNNLGVTLEALAERTGDARYRSRALALYSESARAYDALTRDPKSMVRSGSTNLAFLNTRGSLYPERRFVPQIYAEIDKDGLEPSAWEELLAE